MFVTSQGVQLHRAGLASGATFSGQQALERRLELATSARPDMSPAELRALHQEDKALTLQTEQDKTMADVAWHEARAVRQRQKEYWQQRRDAIANGYLY